MNLGDKISTPRFGTVKISTMFTSNEEATEVGYTEPTHYRDEAYHIRGKQIESNRMVFAAIKRD